MPHRGLLRDPERGAARCEALLAATEAVVFTLGPEGHPQEEQPSWSAYTGQDPQAYGELGWLDAIHEDDRAVMLSRWQSARATGSPFLGSYRLWHAPSQAWRKVAVRAAPVRDAGGAIVEWMGTVTDIHDRPLTVDELHRVNQTLSEQLEAQGAELRRLFDLSMDILLCIGADGRLLTVSPSFEAVVGTPAAQAVGRHYSDFVVPEEAQRVADEIAATLRGRSSVDFETQLRRSDGTLRAVAWRAVGLPDERRVYAVGRDITVQKQAQQRTIRAERLEAVGRLTGGIAHDFNNILAAMMGYLEVGVRSAAEPRARQLFQSALEAGRRGATLVSHLLGFARRQELSLRPVDLNALLRELRPLLQQAIGPERPLSLELDEAVPPVLVDPTQVEMVVLNLAINARDAMQPQGRLVLRTWLHEIGAPATRIDDLPQGRYGCISVIDDGHGMDEATLARCFEPFYTTKPAGHGTGLGLAQALGVVHHCGGTLRVESRPGVGTRVDVLLPEASPPVEPGEAPTPPTLARPSVMVVEDDALVLQSTTALVEALGFDVTPVADGTTAVAALVSGRPFEVVLADYQMPGMTGAEVLRHAFQLRPKVTGILMTGEVDLARIQSELPGVAVLPKPLQPTHLAALLGERVGDHRRATGEDAAPGG